MGYIVGAYPKNSVVTFPVALLQVSDGEAAVNPTIVTGDWQVSSGGAFANPTTPPVVSPAGGRQIVVTLGVAETPGPWTTVQFVDQDGPKVYHDNFWTLFFGNVSSTSGSVVTVNPAAFIDPEAVANLVGPYIANLLVNTLNMPTEAEWNAIIAQAADITAVKAKTDLLAFTSGRINANVGAIETAQQTVIQGLVFSSLTDPANTLAELGVGALPTAPTPAKALTALYMQLRNGTLTTATSPTAGTRTIRNAAGTTISVGTMSKSATVVDTGKLDS